MSDYYNLSVRTSKKRTGAEHTDITSIPPDDSNVVSLNTVRKISFLCQRPRGTWFHLASSRSGIRINGKFAIGKTGIRQVGATDPSWGTGNANSLKDSNITLDNAFFGRLFDNVVFRMGSMLMEDISSFPEYFQLMSNLYKDEIKDVYATMAGIHPDKSTETNPNPNVVITAVARTDIGVGVATSLAVVYTHNAAVAANGFITVNIPGTLSTWKLQAIAAYAAHEKGQYLIRYTFVAVIPAQTDTFLEFDGVVVRARTDGATTANLEASFGIAYTPTRAVKMGEEFTYPLLGPTNRAYNSGFRDRLLEYNYKIDAEGKTRNIEIFVPLYLFLGFAAFYDKLICNFPFSLTFQRAPDNNEFWGSKGLDGDFKIETMALEIENIYPTLSMQTQLLDEIKKPQRYSFSTPYITSLLITTIDFSVPFQFPRPADYIFIFFKDHSHVLENKTALRSKTLLTHANIKDLVLTINTKKYPLEPQNQDFVTGNFKKFYNEFSLATKELMDSMPINTDDYRDLYPIFGFNLSDEKTILQSNTAVNLTVTGKRTGLEPKDVTVYVIGLVSSKYTVDYNTLSIKDWTPERV